MEKNAEIDQVTSKRSGNPGSCRKVEGVYQEEMKSKRKKKKRISCKKQIRILNKKNEILSEAHVVLQEEIKSLGRIITALGSDKHLQRISYLKYALEDITEEIKIRPEQYGDYIVFGDKLDAELKDAAKKEMAEAIARGMIEKNAIRFIYKSDLESGCTPLDQFETLAAKVSVIPWYELVKREEDPDHG